MKPACTPNGWADYVHWQTADRHMLKRLNELLDDVLRDPTAGIGKPEPLRRTLPGTWSRRIDDEHRLVYVVDEDAVTVLAARYHHEQ